MHSNTSKMTGYARWFLLIVVLLTLLPLAMWRAAWALPSQGPGGPILVIAAPNSPFGSFYAEILRTEGFNSFAVADPGAIDPTTLAQYDVVVLAKQSLSSTQVTRLNDWVNAGGNLIAMAPDAQLAPLLGLTPAGGTAVSEGYLQIDTGTRPGNGIVSQTIQFHGSADRYTLNGATRVATLFTTATVATVHPAVSLRSAGSGKAAFFAFDLANSIVQSRQGNPLWATQERDGFAPIRSDDKFYGNAAADPRPDWVDLGKVAIPQADELQRLFANLVLYLNESKKPLPRFWYFPNGKKAVVVMTGDDHGNNGTAGRFDQFKAASTPGCNVANWECVRGTSYLYPSTPLAAAAAAQYAADGFEVGVHINTGCSDFDAVSLEGFYAQQIGQFQSAFPGLPPLVTERHHCIVWSDWTTGAQVQLNHGIRMDTSYYYWPPSWANNTPGLFTGSAMPMRYAAPNGDLIDVFQAATQMTDESGQAYPFTPDTLLDRAIGAEGYYGAYVINAHTDAATIPESTTTVASAQARGVPIISAAQLLTWVDGRNASSFSALSWSGSTLSFTLNKAPAANGLQAMLPLRAPAGTLTALTRAGNAVPFTAQVIKGVEYAFFAADGGSYTASYSTDTTAPAVVSMTPAAGAQAVDTSTVVTAVFSEAMDPATVNASTVVLTDGNGAAVAATVTYDAATRSATLRPQSLLGGGGTYTLSVRGGGVDPRAKDAAGNPAASFNGSFSTAAGTTCPCNGFGGGSTPTVASANDPNPVELGVKFTVDVAGTVSGVRFYKGPTNTGTHVGNLWSSTGTLLATATFGGESAGGWQQVNFTTPVAVQPNTVYVASYYTSTGGYAVDLDYFTSTGVKNGAVNLLRDGVAGGNGVYQYGSQSSFPASSYRSSNYWVDIAFTPASTADTTPPTVSSTTPAANATNVAASTTVKAVFSESMADASITTGSFVLRNAANAVVTAAVSYDAATRTATLVPASPLEASQTYTATVVGGGTDPRVKDAAGNALVQSLSWSFTTSAAAGTCANPANAIAAENCLTGNPATEWDVSGAGDATIQGYATQISVNRGSTVFFKVNSTASSYRFDIYRLGYYNGLGARKVATMTPSATLPQAQPSCLSDVATGLVDCGNWAVSGSWAVPANAVSGVYIARLVRNDNGGASHIVFVVRDDASTSKIVLQTSDTTWHAYNDYGGNSLYTGSPGTNPSRAYKVSYNRPFNTRAVANGEDWLFNGEYPMIRWLESNGYDVSYTSGVDTDRAGSLLLNHRVFVSVGHDEYWSAAQRANVEAARGAGVNLAFLSGNEIFWKTRWENSIDGSATPYRTLVSYKETHAGAKIDPNPAWTGTWRDARFSPPADGGRPENALSGTIFTVNGGAPTAAITVPAADGKMRLWRGTSVATLAAGSTATLSASTLGYEWDSDVDNGARPPGLVNLSTTQVSGVQVLQDQGSTYASGSATHRMTFYKHASGAKVFSAGTVQWTWGLDARHDGLVAPTDVRIQQAMVNLLADMDSQPTTLQAGLVEAAASTDTVAPTTTISAPLAGESVPTGVTYTIRGTATDTGGGVVGGVEVSLDNGTTWHPATTGRENWTYAWTPGVAGTPTIRVRAVDDSGNLQAGSASVTVTVAPKTCPCTIWSPSTVPTTIADPDTASVNLGVKFTADQAGFISGIRFYKGAGNTGTHVGSLWSSAGTLLATATFSGETASGWQQVNFSAPVAVTANTVYVASYLAPAGRYSVDEQYFTNAPYDSAPLHALQNGTSGGNGVYVYAAGNAFPSQTYGSSNYWVDVVFSTTLPDTTPPTVSPTTPTSGATNVSTTANITATFSEAMNAATIGASTVQLLDAANAVVASTISYDTVNRIVTIDPTPTLANATTYRVNILGGTTDPRVKDSAGNAMTATATWTFTTAAAADTTPPTVAPTSPASGATGVAATANVTATFSEAMDAATISGSTVQLLDAANAVVASTVTYNATTRVVTLDPTPTLANSATYRVNILGGATDPRVKDSAGNAMTATATWTFTTAAAADTTPPTVTAVSPASGATGVSATANVTATFSEAMDAATISGTTVQLRDAANALVAATVTYNATTRVVTLDPTPTLASGATYRVNILGGSTDPRVKDSAGNALATTATWTFTTADTTPPTITAQSPAANATGVGRTANITVTFSEAMDATTINGNTFQLRTSGGALVAATVTYNATTRVATLDPSATLGLLTTYTVNVLGGTTDPRVKDTAGNAMATTRTWSFRTGIL